MTEQVTGAIKHAVMGHKNDKIDQLKAHMVEPTENSRITSDYGVKQNNTDQWLRVATEDQTGPSLLEDTFGREKVCTYPPEFRWRIARDHETRPWI